MIISGPRMVNMPLKIRSINSPTPPTIDAAIKSPMGRSRGNRASGATAHGDRLQRPEERPRPPQPGDVLEQEDEPVVVRIVPGTTSPAISRRRSHQIATGRGTRPRPEDKERPGRPPAHGTPNSPNRRVAWARG